MSPSFLITLFSIWQCCPMSLSHNTKEVQWIRLSNTSKREKRAGDVSNMNTGEQGVNPDHIDVILQTIGISFVEQSFGQHCVEAYITGYHDVFRGDCHKELTETLNKTIQLPCKGRCTIRLDMNTIPSAVICLRANGLHEICHESLINVDCSDPFRVTLKCSDQQNYTDTCIRQDTNKVTGAQTGDLIGALLGGLFAGIMIPPLLYLFFYFRKKTCAICQVINKWKNIENTGYQGRIDNVVNETGAHSAADESDKYTTIQNTQVRATSNVYRDTIHETIPTPPRGAFQRESPASNGSIPNTENDFLYSDADFEIDMKGYDEYQGHISETKTPKNYKIDLLRRTTSITSKEDTRGIPSYVTIIGEGEQNDFKVVHKCSSCQKRSLFKIKELEKEIEEDEQLDQEDIGPITESPCFMSEQTEDSDIDNYKKMNEAISEL